MINISQLIRANPIVGEDGRMQERFRSWTQQVTQLQVLTGSGSPEGAVEASIGTFYMDTGGSAGSILFIKRDADSSGDRSQGWIAV